MAIVKGLNRINKIINDFTQKNFGVTAELNAEFQAFCGSKVINYTLFYDEDSRKFFMDDAEARFPDVKADIFLWCLMHEIGHCMTDDAWTEADTNFFLNIRDEYLPFVEDDQMRYDLYHALPDEFIATNWAGNYMRKHPKKIAKFWAELQPAIIRMYKKNGVI